MKRRIIVCTLLLCLLWQFPSFAQAHATGLKLQYIPLPSVPVSLVFRGNELWIGTSTPYQMLHFARGGKVQSFSWPSDGIDEIANYLFPASDGSLWMSSGYGGASYVYHFTAKNCYARYLIPTGNVATYGVVGPDRSLWFTDNGWYITHVTPNGGITTLQGVKYINQDPLMPGPSFQTSIVYGPDQNIWFAYAGLYRLTPYGTLTAADPFNGSLVGPRNLLVLPGAFWYTSYDGHIGILPMNGKTHVYTFDVEGSNLLDAANIRDVVLAHDGTLWFLDGTYAQLVHSTVEGHILGMYPLPTYQDMYGISYVDLNQMIIGPDNALWATDYTHQRIIRITLP